MRNKLWIRLAAICMAVLLTVTPAEVSAASVLHKGSKGSEVISVQKTLKDLGYYTYSRTTGYYGDITIKAVKRFQKDNGLYADGKVGNKTLSLLTAKAAGRGDIEAAAGDSLKTFAAARTGNDGTAASDMTLVTTGASTTTLDDSSVAGAEGKSSEDNATAVSGSAVIVVPAAPQADNTGLPVKQSSGASILMIADTAPDHIGALDWFRDVRYIWERGVNATVTDVETGLSFRVKRTYGTNHADVEPLTSEDTATIKKIWGGFSWDRRAVVVQIGEYTIAASMTAMPHAGVDSKPANQYVSNRSAGYGRGINLDTVKNNGCSGHMDIHFKNSRTHTTNRTLESQQNMVRKAAAFLAGLI